MRARPAEERCACAGASPAGEAEELRCGCGSLLARVGAGHVELKCRRCKRVWRIPLQAS